jgi:hypothetical protein
MIAFLLVVGFALLTVVGASTSCWLLYDGMTHVRRKRIEPEYDVGA